MPKQPGPAVQHPAAGPASPEEGRAYDRALRWLLDRINYESIPAVPYDARRLRLGRMRRLLDVLGQPDAGLRIVHVAGTKGKGSTSAMIASVLTAARYRTGLFSSPHLDRVEERLAVDGAACTPDDFVQLAARVRAAVVDLDRTGPDPADGALGARPAPAEVKQGPTYFDCATAMALLHFAQQGVDVAVLEVGLGGRLDSTNVCQASVSVITSISLDHTKQLGSTLAAIAGEKAGIIKSGVPVVSGVLQEAPRRVINQVAAAHGCRVAQLGRDFQFRYTPPQDGGSDAVHGKVDFQTTSSGGSPSYRELRLQQLGRHQAANAAVALAVVTELRRQGLDIPEAAVREGLAHTRLPARAEVVARRPTVLVDAAHNRASAEALVELVDESFQARRRILVFACSKEKDVRGMLQVLAPRFNVIVLTRYRTNPRSIDPHELERLAAEYAAADRVVCPHPAEAWRRARDLATRDDLIVVAGSFFLAAEMRREIVEGLRVEG